MITPLKRFLCPAEFSGHRTGCLVLAVHPEQSEAPLAARPWSCRWSRWIMTAWSSGRIAWTRRRGPIRGRYSV